MKNRSTLTDAQKTAIFAKNMAIAEAANQVAQAAGRSGHNHRASYPNAAGYPMIQRPELRTLTFTITNTGTATQNAVLFGKDFAPQSGADIQIKPQIAGSTIASINSDVATSPLAIHDVLFNAKTDNQMQNPWDLNFANSFGKKESSQFFPQNYVDPANNTLTLIKTAFPKFTASSKNWMEIPIEPGNTVMVNFTVGAQLSLEGIAQGTHTIE